MKDNNIGFEPTLQNPTSKGDPMTTHLDDIRRPFRSPVHRAVAAALALAPIALLGSPGALAQDNAATMGLEEIVVTARKTEEKLTEVPLSIAAYTS